MASEFDRYVESYRDIINRGAALTGETFEYFIGLRLGLLRAALGSTGEPSPRRILDFGSGIGATLAQIREQFPRASLDGIDSSLKSVEAAEKLSLRDTRFHHSDAIELPFPTGTFDLVYSNGTFHHINPERHDAIFAELVRVLLPGGHAFIFENNPLNPVMVREMRRNPFDADARMLFPWQLRNHLRLAGLRARSPRYYVFLPKQLKRIWWTERYLRRVPLGAQYYVWATKPASPSSSA
jgi:SAM-dependent methyltransferase